MLSFLRTGFWLVLLSNLSNVFNYLQMIVVSRWLSKQDLSIFSSVTATGIVITSFLSVVPSLYVLVNSDTFVDEVGKEKNLKALNKLALYVSVVFFLLFFVLSFSVSGFLKISTPLPMLLYSTCLLNSLILQIFVGHCLLEGRYKLIQIQVLLLSFLKLLFTFLSFHFFGDLLEIVFFSEFFATLLSVFFLYKVNGFSGLGSGIKGLKVYIKQSIPVSATLFIGGALLSIDLLLAKRFFSESDAADYTVGSNLGKIAFFISGAVSSIVFAASKKKLSQGQNATDILLFSCFVAFLCGGVVCVSSLLFPELIVLTLFGEKYISSIGVFKVLSFSMTLLAVNTIFFNYFLARKVYFFIKVPFCVLAFIFLYPFLLEVPNVEGLANLILYSMFFVLFMNIYFYIKLIGSTK